MVRGGPQDAGSVHQIAVILNADAQAAMFAVSECGTHGRGGAVPDAGRASSAHDAIVLVDIPEPGPIAAYHRPVLVLDHVPDLGRHARGADGAGVPGVRGGGTGLFKSLGVSRRELFAPFLECSFAVRGDEALCSVNQRRKSRL